MKYEVVCTKSYLDVGLMIEQDNQLKPKRVLARSFTYSSDREYGIYEGLTWVKTGVFLSKDEWIEISHNKPTDKILSELGINKTNYEESINHIENCIKLTTNVSGDWHILEINGTEFASGHSISEYDWLELLRKHFGCNIETDCISDEEMELRC